MYIIPQSYEDKIQKSFLREGMLNNLVDKFIDSILRNHNMSYEEWYNSDPQFRLLKKNFLQQAVVLQNLIQRKSIEKKREKLGTLIKRRDIRRMTGGILA